jgi:hypothetical protein
MLNCSAAAKQGQLLIWPGLIITRLTFFLQGLFRISPLCPLSAEGLNKILRRQDGFRKLNGV